MSKSRRRFAVWWGRSGMGLRVTLLLGTMALLGLLLYWQRPESDSGELISNLMFFVLLNLIVVVLAVLAFLIARNIIKLVFDRRRGLVGSKLRLKLVLTFVALALVPTSILFLVASGIVNRAMQGWFSRQIEETVDGSVQVARQHYSWLEKHSQRVNATVRKKLVARDFGASDSESLVALLEREREAFDLFSLRVIRGHEVLAEASSAASVVEDFSEPPLQSQSISAALRGDSVTVFEEKGASQFVRTYGPLKSGDNALVLVDSIRIDPEFSAALSSVMSSYDEHKRLSFFRRPLKSSYLLILAMITGMILFGAIWIGFYIAREITVPIQRLAQGMQAIARGNYDVQVRASGDDEIAFLVRSFNQMAADLGRTTAESERRRLYIETMLTNLGVGVVAFDAEERVTLTNPVAMQLLGIMSVDAIVGRPVREVLTQAGLQGLEPLLVSAAKGAAPVERELSVERSGRAMRLVCTLGRMVEREGRQLGSVLLLDDVSELSKAQQMAAWREVARRIAHEIKNPLTPIQLSAQRLQRLFSGERSNATVTECAQAIVENVDSIKRLANEFSKFARMPTAEFSSCSLGALISDTVAPYAQAHPEIVFQFIAQQGLPDVVVDREQIRRALINILDNAVDVLSVGVDSPRVAIRAHELPGTRRVQIEVADNGPGVPMADKARLFEPYFTTKQHGTGLGLAIVNSIVADHQGTIQVLDNQPTGARFVIELPLAPEAGTQRRFGVG